MKQSRDVSPLETKATFSKGQLLKGSIGNKQQTPSRKISRYVPTPTTGVPDPTQVWDLFTRLGNRFLFSLFYN